MRYLVASLLLTSGAVHGIDMDHSRGRRVPGRRRGVLPDLEIGSYNCANDDKCCTIQVTTRCDDVGKNLGAGAWDGTWNEKVECAHYYFIKNGVEMRCRTDKKKRGGKLTRICDNTGSWGASQKCERKDFSNTKLHEAPVDLDKRVWYYVIPGGTKKGPVSRKEMWGVITNKDNIDVGMELQASKFGRSSYDTTAEDAVNAAVALMTKTEVSRVVDWGPRDETWTTSGEAFPEVHTPKWKWIWMPEWMPKGIDYE